VTRASSERVVRALASFDGGGPVVTTCYLDVDGRRVPRAQDIEHHFDGLVRRAGAVVAHPTVAADLERIGAHLRNGIDRQRVRGLAVFACAPALWEVVELPVTVRDQLVVDRRPHLTQLETVLSAHESLAVLLVDRQRARLLVFELGALIERSEIFDGLPRHDDDGGEWDRDHVRDHADAVARRHLRHAADATFAMWQDTPFDHLVVGGPEEILGDLERELHSYLRRRIAARIAIAVTAPDDAIVAAVRDVEVRLERARDAALVGALRDALGTAGNAVVGLDATLAALVEHRVDTLLVSEGFESPGWRCAACRWVGTRGRPCPLCAQPMEEVDAVEEAVDEALRVGARVRMCRGNADLDVLGRIGALLRF
jgi:peptide chain release factor subunit 1